MSKFHEMLPIALESDLPFALAMISDVKGSSPQKQGAKALFFADGRIAGTLGGGCLEAEIQDRARRSLMTGVPATFELVLDHDFGWDDGLVCGGKVCGVILPVIQQRTEFLRELAAAKTQRQWGVRGDFTLGWREDDSNDWLYLEQIRPVCALWVAGSGHVAQAVVPLALQLDFAVTIFDDRPALANADHFPPGTQFRVDHWERILTTDLPEQPAFGLVVTRGHQHDALVLKSWIHRPFQFLGMIGSRRKARVIAEQFVSDGIATAEQMAAVACPVGVDIKAVSVPEIALSVMAQYIQKRAELVYGRVESPFGRKALAQVT